ncbi:hypothetical protein [Ottowia thiooxydans]|uniref:Uncharacterized protein n=1 Tax=Ottowia thiooxydans TaxID=219182 RepID=A0ABV2Q7Z0_9BURK
MQRFYPAMGAQADSALPEEVGSIALCESGPNLDAIHGTSARGLPEAGFDDRSL